MAAISYRVMVDWGGDGTFGHANADISPYVLSAQWSLGGEAFRRVAAGTASVRLANGTGMFSPGDPDSPLHGVHAAGKLVRVQIRATGGWVTKFQGRVRSISASSALAAGTSTAELSAHGIISELANLASSAPLQSDVATGAAMASLLDAAGIPASRRNLDAGQAVLKKFWVSPESDLLSAMRELEDQELGAIVEGEDGRLLFFDRAHQWDSPSSNTVQADYGDTGAENEVAIYDADETDDTANMANTVTVPVRQFNLSPDDAELVAVYDVVNQRGGTPPMIAPGETLYLDVDYPTADAPSGYVGVDQWGIVEFEANTHADRSGVDVTPQIAMTRAEVGQRMAMSFANGTPAAAYVVALRIRGRAIVDGSGASASASRSESIGLHGKRAYGNPPKWFSDADDAAAAARYIVDAYAARRRAVAFSVAATDATRAADIAARKIGDRVHVRLTGGHGLHIDADFIVAKVSHRASPDRPHQMTLSCVAPLAARLAASGDPAPGYVVDMSGWFLPPEKQNVRRAWEGWRSERPVLIQRAEEFEFGFVQDALALYLQRYDELFAYLDGQEA